MNPRIHARFLGSSAAAFLLLAAGGSLAAIHPTIPSTPAEALLGACLLLSYRAARGSSLAMRIYVFYILLWFLLAPIAGSLFPSVNPGLSSSETGAVWLTVSIWLLGWSAGLLMVQPRTRTSLGGHTRGNGGLTYQDASYGLIVVGIVALLIEISQAAHGSSAYATQIAGGATTSTTSAIAGLAAPALTTAFVFAWPTASRYGRVLLASLIFIQAGVSTFSGFRGPATELLISTATAYLIIHPSYLRQRRRWLARWLLIILVVGIPLTLVAGAHRQEQATAVGHGNTTALSLSRLPGTVVKRFDEMSALSAGLNADGPTAKRAVRMDHQFEILVPRVLWPGKPVFNYGEQVSVAIYGVPASYYTSSTVTWLGDLYLNGGLPAVLVAGVVLAAMARRIFDLAVEGPVFIVLTAVLFLELLFNAELPLVLNFAGDLRSLLGLTAACFGGRAIRDIVGAHRLGASRRSSKASV